MRPGQHSLLQFAQTCKISVVWAGHGHSLFALQGKMQHTPWRKRRGRWGQRTGYTLSPENPGGSLEPLAFGQIARKSGRGCVSLAGGSPGRGAAAAAG